MSDLVIFDTSVLVDEFRTGRHRKRIESVDGLVRTSLVVLAELWRGATRTAERDFLRTLGNNHPILTPTGKNLDRIGPDIIARFAPITASRRASSAIFTSTSSSPSPHAPMEPASSPRTALTSRPSITIASFCV
jgi:hypothetical protein